MDLNIKIEKRIFKNTDEWLELRKKLIGASEIAEAINISSYGNRAQLLLKKLGIVDIPRSKNIILGEIYEKYIADYFQYYEDDVEQTHQNFIKNLKKRTLIYEPYSYVVNINDVPFIVSPDYYEEIENRKIPYEIKFLSFWNNRSIIDITSGRYAYQLLLQMLLYDSDHGYLCVQVANSDSNMYKIDRDKLLSVFDKVLEECASFYNELDELKKLNDTKEIFSVLGERYRFFDLSNTERSDNAPPSKTPNVLDEKDIDTIQRYLEINKIRLELERNIAAIKKYFNIKYSPENVIENDRYIVKLKPFQISEKYEPEVS